jgi:hypothetical protein
MSKEDIYAMGSGTSPQVRQALAKREQQIGRVKMLDGRIAREQKKAKGPGLGGAFGFASGFDRKRAENPDLMGPVLPPDYAEKQAKKMASEHRRLRSPRGTSGDATGEANLDAMGILERDFGDGSGKSFRAGGGVSDTRPTLGTTINRITNEYSPKVDVAITANQRPGESTGEFAERVKSMLQDELGKMHRRGYDHFLGAVVG